MLGLSLSPWSRFFLYPNSFELFAPVVPVIVSPRICVSHVHVFLCFCNLVSGGRMVRDIDLVG